MNEGKAMPNLPRIMWYLAGAMRRLNWDSRKLRKHQERKLRSVVMHAYESVPFYHRKFRQAGVTPNDIKSLDDLSKLPLVRKADLRREPEQNLISRDFRIEELALVRTSGSTGEPFHIRICGKEGDWRKAIYMRANISCGQRPRDKWVVLTAPHHFGDTTSVQRRLGIYAQTCISLFNTADVQIRLVQKYNPDILDGYSGSLLLLAKEIDGRSLNDVTPRIVFGTAEIIDSASCQFIEKVFHAPYYDQFGCAELDRTAWQCPEKASYHRDEDSVVVQFVDQNGDAVSSGEKGEIVYTSLFNYAMPFIRYAVGDIGMPSDEECPCGRTLPLMKIVEGRKDSILLLPDGRPLSPRTFTNAINMFNFSKHIEQFRVVQKRPDLFEIYIKKKINKVDEDIMRKDLQRHLRETLNLHAYDIVFDIRFLEDIPLDKSGKLNAVHSEVKAST